MMKLVLLVVCLVGLGQIDSVHSHCDAKFEKDLFDDLTRMMWKLKGSGNHAQDKPKDIPAFSAHRNSVQALSAGTIVVFDKIFTQNGNAYSPRTGIFTASIDGLYHFTAVVMSESNKVLFLNLVHNDKPISSSYVSGSGHSTGSFDVVLRLVKGDTVAIKSLGHNQSIYSSVRNYCTFSGYFIAE